MDRPYFHSSYYELEDLYQNHAEKYLAFLTELESELDRRSMPFSADLHRRVEMQIGILKPAMRRPSR